MLEIPTEDLCHVGTIKVRIYMPVHFVQKWVLPTIQVRKALQKLEDKSLPGGIETAMLYSIYDQSVMDLNRSTSANLADNHTLRAMVAHAKEDTVKHLSLLKEGTQSQTNGLLAALQQIKEVTHLPNVDLLWDMSEHEIRMLAKKRSPKRSISMNIIHEMIMQACNCYVSNAHVSPIWYGNSSCTSATLTIGLFAISTRGNESSMGMMLPSTRMWTISSQS
jgi:hypothetical protein